MDYLGSYKFLFRRPDWLTNGALVMVCNLIPIVGPMVIMGYFHEIFLLQLRNPEADYPRFNFSRFTDYLVRGLYPFLVMMVASFVLVPFFYLSFVPLLAIPALELEDAWIALPVLATVALYLGFMMIFAVAITPLYLRAILLQEFGGAFNVRFARRFMGFMWWDILKMQLFLMVTALPLALVGVACCYVGIFPVSVLITFAYWSLQIQLYQLYLARGGEAVPVKVFPPPQFGQQGPGFEVQRPGDRVP